METRDYPTVDALAPAQIYAKAAAVGEAKATMPARKLFALSQLAGVFIGMGGMFMLLVKSDQALSFAASSILGGLAFSLGLFAVIVAGAELFTGNNLMVIGMAEGCYRPSDLLRSWGIVYVGNLCGSVLLAIILHFANFAGMNGGAVGATMVSVAAAKCGLPWMVAFFRGVMCNLLVCLAVWMGFAGKSVADKVPAAVLPVVAFVACGFEHCVANMFFIPMGFITLWTSGAPAGVDVTALTLAGFLSNLTAATLGNVVGGALYFSRTYRIAFGSAGKE